jgi:hypothetical protein
MYYCLDGFTPEIFNLWTGISIIAAALERKVWFEYSDTFHRYPNIFVLLVATPGQGKSTALNRGLGLLRDIPGSPVNILPSQLTEAALLIEMSRAKKPFYVAGQEHFQSAGYFAASEASDSIKEVYGDITSSMTNLYDCLPEWSKSTKSEGNIPIKNACLNVFAGCTFDYLRKIVTESNTQGGFASRLTYVICREEKIRSNVFPDVPTSEEALARRLQRSRLVNDLRRINEMRGPFAFTSEFREAFTAWNIELQQRRKEIRSEDMKSLSVRLGDTMFKLCMIMSAAESSDRIMKLAHFKKAEKLTRALEEDLPSVFRDSKAGNVKDPGGIYNTVQKIFSGPGREELSRNYILQKLTSYNFDPIRAKQTVEAFIESNMLVRTESGKFKFVDNS